MLSLAVIWNTANEYNSEIINDVADRVKILEQFEINLGQYYQKFVYDIYYNEQKNKIDKKYNSMMLFSNRSVTVIVFEFDDKKVYFHPQKNKNVYAELNDLKVYIRDKYSKKIVNYYFDNVFHCTDDVNEFKHNYKITKKYLRLVLLNNLKNVIDKEEIDDKRKSR